MKTYSLILVFLAITATVLSQSWTSSSQLIGSGDITEVQSTSYSDGSIITFGFFNGSLEGIPGGDKQTMGGNDYFLMKFNPTGGIEWVNQLGSLLGVSSTGGVGVTSDGSIFVTGGYRGYLKYSLTDSIESTGGFDTFLAKYDLDGNFTWVHNIGTGARANRSTALSINNEDNILLAGWFSDSIFINENTTLYSNNSVNDYYYGKFDQNDGDLIWIKQVRGITGYGNIFSIASGADYHVFSGVYFDSIGFGNDTIVSMNNSVDVHLFKTDYLGNIEWLRNIKGDSYEYSYSVALDSDENIILAGYYNSASINIDSTENHITSIDVNEGDYDLFVSQYNTIGELQWIRNNGGKGTDKIFDISITGNDILVSGLLSDTVFWGGIELTTEGISDQDMFTGSLDVNGNYRSANSYSGINNSKEEARAIFLSDGKQYTVIRSNSEILQLGDSIYTSSTGKFYIVLGIIGCLPISVDETIPTNIAGCFGDSTGSILVVASGGFGAPWQYSIDNGLIYTPSAFYDELPAGDYQIVVIDKENCTQVGPLITLTEPDTLEVQVVSTEDITEDHDGAIVVEALGGTGPYTFWLQPDGDPQNYGTFVFVTGDSGKYVVAVDDNHNCGPVLTDSLLIIEIFDTTGIGTSSGLLVKVYPNPTSGIITIEMPFDGSECGMEVLSMTGQLVLKRKVYSSGGVITETLDLSDQAKGLYMLRINGQALRSAIMVK